MLVKSCSSKEACEWLKSLDPLQDASTRAVRAEPKQQDVIDAEYEAKQHRKAARMWANRRPIAGTIAERYLREVRGFGYALPLSATLGFLPPYKLGYHP